ncbi:MAG: SRPBCC family protein [Actinomycetota bacterium]
MTTIDHPSTAGTRAAPSPVAARVQRTIAATPEAIYDIVTDVTRMGEWSPETTEARWIKGSTHATVGARFVGKNRLGSTSWSTKPTVIAADRGRRFAFSVPGKSGATWTYEFESIDGGTLVTESVSQDRPSPAPIRWLQRRAGVTDRSAHLAADMATTLERLDRAATA